MSDLDFVVLITAKLPVPGRVKTRLCPPFSPEQAAQLATAALLDTLDAAVDAVEGLRDHVVVSIDGSLDAAIDPTLGDEMSGCVVIEQRGAEFGARLRHAHEDAARVHPGRPVVQIGMDTPQITPTSLRAAAAPLLDGSDAVLGTAEDGGWWLLGLANPGPAAVLPGIPMSTPHTGRVTRDTLERLGLRIADAGTIADVDTYADALRVAAICRDRRFGRAMAELAPRDRNGWPPVGPEGTGSGD